ncbi:HNH endonuclease [Leuconostoc sp. LN180020]|uniref:HNH endonuclease n=1 Tax=Leuconostoc sp. LN180020 TaxID=2571156 RepID=UPI00353001B3
MFTCECCGRTSTTKGYLVVDHIIPRKIDKRKQLDKGNLWVCSYTENPDCFISRA